MTTSAARNETTNPTVNIGASLGARIDLEADEQAEPARDRGEVKTEPPEPEKQDNPIRLAVPATGPRLFPRRPDPQAIHSHAVVEGAPPVLPPLGDIVHFDDVEAERRLLGVDRVRAVEFLDALREDVEQERELGLPADDDVPLEH